MKSHVPALGARIDLNLFVLFDAVYRARNLTTAGRAVGLSQSAMSHALSRLRSAFKDPLFVRDPRGLRPTPLAAHFAPILAEGLETIRRGLEGKSFDPTRSARTFTIGMGDIAEVVQLPHLIRALHTAAPHVRINTVQIPGPRLRDALADGEVDLATGDYVLGAGCREAPLYQSEYACVARADHPVIGERLTLKQFKAAEHILVAPEGASPHGRNIERLLTSRRIGARIAVQISHFHGVAALIAATDLIATVPARLALAMRELSDIKMWMPPVALPKINVSLYWHERHHREPGNAWLRQAYIKLFRS